MIIDSSAVIAILLKEPGYERVRDRLAASQNAGIGAPTVVESSLVLCSRLGHAGKTLLARFLQEATSYFQDAYVRRRAAGGNAAYLPAR